ncbi:AMMECR1 domain-containing protein, partial [Streptomyces caniscabiei]|uniref:AMMECR1 domain-containing protein n=1 Tax=Streptomyces caniscabiei TaxID=2746961 RepID=UPI0038F73748
MASTGDLRGCIGTIEATQPTLAQEIIANAISASTRDPRFPAIRPEELFDLRINVDVLKAAEPATIDMLDPARYGVIVTQGFRRG